MSWKKTKEQIPNVGYNYKIVYNDNIANPIKILIDPYREEDELITLYLDLQNGNYYPISKELSKILIEILQEHITMKAE